MYPHQSLLVLPYDVKLVCRHVLLPRQVYLLLPLYQGLSRAED